MNNLQERALELQLNQLLSLDQEGLKGALKGLMEKTIDIIDHIPTEHSGHKCASMVEYLVGIELDGMDIVAAFNSLLSVDLHYRQTRSIGEKQLVVELPITKMEYNILTNEVHIHYTGPKTYHKSLSLDQEGMDDLYNQTRELDYDAAKALTSALSGTRGYTIYTASEHNCDISVRVQDLNKYISGIENTNEGPDVLNAQEILSLYRKSK